MMNEWVKTTIYVGVAAAISLIAFVTNPRIMSFMGASSSPRASATAKGGGVETTDVLFPNFDDPLEAKSLEIIRIDEKSSKAHEFKVAQNSQGRWVIPSHSDYP